MVNRSTGNDVVEIRRFCLRSATDISPCLEGLRFKPRPGSEFVIRPDDYENAIKRLKRAGLSVDSAFDRENKLNALHYSKATSKRWGYRVSDPGQWSYLSMITRRWHRCRVDNQGRILLRRGMALADHGTGGRPKYYLVPDDIWFDINFRLEDYRVRGDQAIRGAYKHVLGTLPVPFWDDDGVLLLGLWPNYVIPKEYEFFLSKTLNPLDESLDNSKDETLWAWHPSDRELVERTMKKLRLRLGPWDAGTDWVNTTSLILRRSYSEYLQRRDGGKELKEIIRRKAWEEIKDPVLQRLISKLIRLEYEGDGNAHEFLRFVQNELTTVTNYKDHKEDLIGWVIESSPVLYQGKQLDKRYYRLVLPHFDVVTGWETTRHPDWEGEDRPRIKIFQWQNVPFIGRMKTMSRAPEPVPEKGGRKLRDQALRSIAGVPSVEWHLVKEKAFATFMLDLDGAHWKGCNDLCRYFASYGQIISRNPIECEGLGLLLEDVFGTKFALETEGVSSKFIPDDGEWVYFIGHSSLLQLQECLRLNQDMPVFDLARDQIFRRAYENHALEDGILAWIKYHWGISEEEVVMPFMKTWPEEDIFNSLASLIKEEQIIKVKGTFYYRYSPLSASEMEDFVNDKYLNNAWNKSRSLQHPLYVRSMRLIGEKLTRELVRFKDARKIIVKSAISEGILLRNIKETFDKNGWFGLIGAGEQIKRTQGFIDKYAIENPKLHVYRKDGEYEFKDGSRAPSVEYVCWEPLKELQLRFN